MEKEVKYTQPIKSLWVSFYNKNERINLRKDLAKHAF